MAELGPSGLVRRPEQGQQPGQEHWHWRRGVQEGLLSAKYGNGGSVRASAGPLLRRLRRLRTAPSKILASRSATSVPAQNTLPWGRRGYRRNAPPVPGGIQAARRRPPNGDVPGQFLVPHRARRKFRACGPRLGSQIAEHRLASARFVQLLPKTLVAHGPNHEVRPVTPQPLLGSELSAQSSTQGRSPSGDSRKPQLCGRPGGLVLHHQHFGAGAHRIFRCSSRRVGGQFRA